MKKILIVSPVVSHPALSGNSSRIQQMVTSLKGLGCEIHFLLVPIRFIQDRRVNDEMTRFYGPRYTELNGGKVIQGNAVHAVWRTLMRLGLRKIRPARDVTLTSGIFSDGNKAEFQQIVDRIDPDLLIFEYVLLAELADHIGSQRLKAVDTHDRFANRNQRIRASGGSGTWWSLRPAQEKRLLASFDHVLAIQEHEYRLFSQDLAGSTTQVALVDILDVPAQHHAGRTPSSLVLGYIGSNNQHNVEGLFSFIDRHWPAIVKALPGAQLIVAGGISSRQPVPNVRFVGRVGDLWDDLYRQCSAVVNPCLSGTGLKIKTIEAMSYGLPVVTTPEGCSGIESAIGQGLVCSDLASDAFQAACVGLLQDDVERARQSRLARAYIQNAMDKSVAQLRAILT